MVKGNAHTIFLINHTTLFREPSPGGSRRSVPVSCSSMMVALSLSIFFQAPQLSQRKQMPWFSILLLLLLRLKLARDPSGLLRLRLAFVTELGGSQGTQRAE